MARGPRKRSRSGVYHVMLRGINRQAIFESDDDRIIFLSVLRQYVELGKYFLYGYCLMDNHIHLLMKEAEDDISTSVKRISSRFVFWYNKKYERCGHLFQERFKSEAVEDDTYFLTALRYIHQNPLKAGLSEGLADYKWTSYHEYINIPSIVNIDLGLNLFSSNRNEAINLFIKYMNDENKDICLEYDDNIKLSDDEVREEIYSIGINSISELQYCDKRKRNDILRILKSTDGVTVRQLSRITGFSKSLIGNL